MTRIASLAHHNLTQAQMYQTQARIQELQMQLSSGQKARRYEGIAGETSRLLNLESTHARTGKYLESNRAIDLRLRSMEQSVSKMFDIASDVKSMLVNAINLGNATELPLAATATDLMNEAARLLNTKLGDRYLFSGTATGTAPVDLSAPGFSAPPPVYPSSADTSYFQGNATRLSNRVADDFDVAWGVTADEGGFEKVMRALNLVASLDNTHGPDTLRLQEALTVINQAIDELPVIRSRIASSQLSLERANSSHQDLQLYMKEAIADIKSIDIPQAITRLANDQTILEASFMTISRLASLTLTNFLR